MSKIVVIFIGILVAPIAFVILFVWLRNKARREAQARAWRGLADRVGGALVPASGVFGGHRLEIPTQDATVVLETRLLSVWDASKSPYHGDGGTYTHAVAPHPGGNGPELEIAGPEVAKHPALGGAGHALPPGTRVFSNTREAVVVMRGAVADEDALAAALNAVSSIVEQARRTPGGPSADS